ncbi:hypothetical protein [Streptomyces avermitilis]|uniref:hypothetical protein n=1 Tax=Streptomyces avermitilis TaxID=33903 RepID=UPI0033A000B3
MSGNNRRRASDGDPRQGRGASTRRAAAQLRNRAVREFNAAAERGLDGVPIAEETQPTYVQFLQGGLDELMAQHDAEARLPAVTERLEAFTGGLANETRRRSLTAVTLAVFVAIKGHACPLWPFC